MPSQIVNVETNLLATSEVESYTPVETSAPESLHHPVAPDAIAEEEEENDTKISEFRAPTTSVSAGMTVSMKYKWRIDLSKTECHWAGWFRGLSGCFLSVRAPRLLLLASIEGLDRELTVGQMQGKFQMQVLPRCGHAVHEDNPAEVARVIASFLVRQRVVALTPAGEEMQLVSAPGC